MVKYVTNFHERQLGGRGMLLNVCVCVWGGGRTPKFGVDMEGMDST